MARKAKRYKAGTVELTKELLTKLNELAFKNCRTPDQELSFMVERELSRGVHSPAPATVVHVERYDDPAPAPETPAEPALVAPVSDQPWTPDQEDQYEALRQERKMSEAQATANRLLNKSFEAAMNALREEVAA